MERANRIVAHMCAASTEHLQPKLGSRLADQTKQAEASKENSMSGSLLLAGKRALITGASSGIGLATAKVFVREGAHVVITGRSLSALKKLQTDLKGLPDKTGEAVALVAGDLTEKGVAAKVMHEATTALGGLDVLVNCAGVLIGGPIQTTTMETWDKNFNTNTRAVFEMMHLAVPHMKKGSAILNVSSVNGLQSFGNTAAYCASKAAVDMLTKCSAVDLAPLGIRVNAVNPGVVVTELQKRGGLDEEKYKAFIERSETVTHPIGRVGKPEEVANLIAFLCSDKAGFITGDSIKIDGGRACLGAR